MKSLREIFSQREPSRAELQAALDALGKREGEARARRNELADNRRELVRLGTAEELIAADRESSGLDIELDQIANQVTHLVREIDRAEGREAVEHTASLLRELPGLAKRAEEARKTWEAAREALATAVTDLERQREAAKREGYSPQRVPPKLFERLGAVLDWLPRQEDRNAGIFAENKPARLWRHKAQLLDEYERDTERN